MRFVGIGLICSLAVATVSIGACSSSVSTSGSTNAGGASASSTSGNPVDAGLDVNAGNPVDAGLDADAAVDPCAPVSYEPVPVESCGDYVRLPCGLPPGVTPSPATCYLFLKDCDHICPTLFDYCQLAADSCDGDAGQVTPLPSGAVDIDCHFCGAGG